MMLSRVALGRIDDTSIAAIENRTSSTLPCHSTYHLNSGTNIRGGRIYTIRGPRQFYPEYIITYKPTRRLVQARRSLSPRHSPQQQLAQDRSRPLSSIAKNFSRKRKPSQQLRPWYGGSSTTSTTPGNINNSNRQSLQQPTLAQSRTVGFATLPTTSSKNSNRSSHCETAAAALASTAAASATAESKNDSSSNTKLCVICWDRPVSYILIPCGHPCLCDVCATNKSIEKLKRKCPQCRGQIKRVNRFYGRVVED